MNAVSVRGALASEVAPKAQDLETIFHRWLSDTQSGALTLSAGQIVKIYNQIEREHEIEARFGARWREDLNPSLRYALLQNVIDILKRLPQSKQWTEVSRIRILISPRPSAISMEPLSSRGQRGDLVASLTQRARELSKLDHRVIALGEILTSRVLRNFPQKQRQMAAEIRDSCLNDPELAPDTILDCAEALARAGFLNTGRSLFQRACEATNYSGSSPLIDPTRFFVAHLSHGKHRGLEDLSQVLPGVNYRREATFLLGIVAGDEVRATSSLNVMTPNSRPRAVEGAVEIFGRQGDFERAHKVANTFAIRPITLQTAWPLIRSDCPATVREKLAERICDIRVREERIEVLIALARLERGKSKRLALLNVAASQVGPLQYPDDFRRKFLVDTALIAFIDKSNVRSLRDTEARSRKERKDVFGEGSSPRGWNENNLMLVAAGYFMAGDGAKTFTLIDSPGEEQRYSLPLRPPTLRDSRLCETAGWLVFFGAYPEAYELLSLMKKSDENSRRSQLKRLGLHAASAAPDIANKVLLELDPLSIDSFRIQLALIEAL